MITATVFATHSNKDFTTTQDQLEYIFKRGLIKKAILSADDLEGEDDEGRQLYLDNGLLEVDGVLVNANTYTLSWELNEVVESHEDGLLVQVIIYITFKKDQQPPLPF